MQKSVRIIFHNSNHNYQTSVSNKASDDTLIQYFNNRFNVGQFNENGIENMQTPKAIEIMVKTQDEIISCEKHFYT